MVKHNFKVNDKVIFIGNSWSLSNDVIYEIDRITDTHISVVADGELACHSIHLFQHVGVPKIITDKPIDTLGTIDAKIKILEEQLKILKAAKLILKGE